MQVMDSKLDSFGSYMEAVRAMPLTASEGSSTVGQEASAPATEDPAKTKTVR
jgi:hypothetical protein